MDEPIVDQLECDMDLDECRVEGTEFLFVEHRMLFDPLTGLPGAALLLDRVAMALSRARRVGRHVGVFVLYDGCVIGSGDPTVRALARSLRAQVRVDDTLARVANRTFVVVCNEIESEEDADGIVDRLLETVGSTCRVGAAMGFPNEVARDLLARAANRAVGAPPKSRLAGFIPGSARAPWFLPVEPRLRSCGRLGAAGLPRAVL